MLLVNDGATCDTACNELLYITRQIRIAIGRDYQRTQRLLIVDTPIDLIQSNDDGGDTEGPSDDTMPLMPQLERDHVDLNVWRREDQAVLPEGQSEPSAWYLVDPSGWVMMRYTTDVNYKDVIGDIKFLLKNSGG
jgi:hypothetical protein